MENKTILELEHMEHKPAGSPFDGIQQRIDRRTAENAISRDVNDGAWAGPGTKVSFTCVPEPDESNHY